MANDIRNHLGEVRKSRGIAAADLARAVGVSRQTIHAIESGAYSPNTGVALRLARELDVPVEALFSLAAEPSAPPPAVPARVLGAAAAGTRVRLCRVGEDTVAIPVSAAPYFLPEADGLVARAGKRGAASVTPFDASIAHEKAVVLAGCDPASSLIAAIARTVAGIEVVLAGASSGLAFEWLNDGAVHVAGSHLESIQPSSDLLVVNCAVWEAGLVTAAGNPRQIAKIEHLARRDVRFVNRQPGSGARAVTNRLLAAAGVEPAAVRGYDDEAPGHLAAAAAVQAGRADCCFATRSAALAFGLGFVPLHSERYDLILRRETAQLPAVAALLDVLQLAQLRRTLTQAAGYDTTDTGRTATAS
ncbi:MAG: substrate-binding domain-containing protein [Bryobacteraceae bacterium]